MRITIVVATLLFLGSVELVNATAKKAVVAAPQIDLSNINKLTSAIDEAVRQYDQETDTATKTNVVLEDKIENYIVDSASMSHISFVKIAEELERIYIKRVNDSEQHLQQLNASTSTLTSDEVELTTSAIEEWTDNTMALQSVRLAAYDHVLNPLIKKLQEDMAKPSPIEKLLEQLLERK